MSAFDLIESDVWPRLREEIAAERRRRMEGLLNVATLEGMRKEQGFIECLEWVLDRANPPKPDDERPNIYD